MTRSLPHLALAFALLPGAVPASAQTAAPGLGDVLKSYGVRPIEPSSPASDFELTSLAGGTASLSDYYGSWVVLTFFATWCGPCRSELPTLERLHQERAEDGVIVLGVSVDDSREPLDPFVRQLKLTFPIVWDQTKQVGAAYRATSIPISYLVSPEGRLVGVSRGSRDWAALAPMFDAALAAVPATLTVEPDRTAYADASQPVATPSVSEPPTAEVTIDTTTPTAGEPFHLDVELHWAGNFEEYLPHPPQILLPEGVVQQAVTAESSSRDGRNQLTYRATLLASEPGRYALDPVEVRYTPRFESTPVAGRVPGPTVEVKAPTVLGLAPGVAAGGAAGVVLVGLAGWLVGRRLRLRRGTETSPAAETFERLRAELEEARKKRLAGDGAGALLALGELDRSIAEASGDGGPDDEARKSLAEAVERARYGGQAPPAEELDRLQRALERRLESLRPDARASARASLQLKDPEN